MTIGERMRVIRKKLALTQSNFGEKIGFKQAVIGQMENGTRNITDRTVMLICEKYGVREKWFRKESGEIFKQTGDTEAAQIVRDFSVSQLGQAIMRAYTRLNEVEKTVVAHYIKSVVKEYEEADGLHTNEDGPETEPGSEPCGSGLTEKG